MLDSKFYTKFYLLLNFLIKYLITSKLILIKYSNINQNF